MAAYTDSETWFKNLPQLSDICYTSPREECTGMSNLTKNALEESLKKFLLQKPLDK